nr:immunoglobulin light chain junction region [Macaca mulatta]
CHHYYSAPNSF